MKTMRNLLLAAALLFAPAAWADESICVDLVAPLKCANGTTGAVTVTTGGQTGTTVADGGMALFQDQLFGLTAAAGSSSYATATQILHQYTEWTSQGSGGSIYLAAFDRVYTIQNDTGAPLLFWPPLTGRFQTAAGLQNVGAAVTIYPGSHIQVVPDTASGGTLAELQ